MTQLRRFASVLLIGVMLSVGVGCNTWLGRSTADIVQPWKDDPAQSVLLTVKDQMVEVNREYFYPLDLAEQRRTGDGTALCNMNKCRKWRMLYANIRATHNTAVYVLASLKGDSQRAETAYNVAAQWKATLEQMIVEDPAHAAGYRSSLVALHAVVAIILPFLGA